METPLNPTELEIAISFKTVTSKCSFDFGKVHFLTVVFYGISTAIELRSMFLTDFQTAYFGDKRC